VGRLSSKKRLTRAFTGAIIAAIPLAEGVSARPKYVMNAPPSGGSLLTEGSKLTVPAAVNVNT